MKMKPEHYNHMKQSIQTFISDHSDDCAKHKAAHTPVRFAWDVCHASGMTPFICSTLYEYLNDTHIQTALLKCVRLCLSRLQSNIRE